MNQIIQVDTPVLMDMTPKWMPATGVPREVGELHDVMGECDVCGCGPGRCEGTLASDGC